MQLASEFFLKVVEAEKILEADEFFQSNGRQASKLVPEILGVLGVFNITQHTDKLDSIIQIEHDLVWQYARYILLKDEEFRSLGKDAEIRWNKAFVLSATHPTSTSKRPDLIRPLVSLKWPLGNWDRSGLYSAAIYLLDRWERNLQKSLQLPSVKKKRKTFSGATTVDC